MAAEIITPVDDLTGTVLPIIPGQLEMTSRDAAFFNEHHGWHPSPLLLKTLAGNALRNSQIEIVHINHHNNGKRSYHAKVGGPQLVLDLNPHNPVIDEQTAAGLVLIACAGYISDEGIDMDGDEPFRRHMTEEEKRFLRTPDPHNQFGYKYMRYSYEPIRDFLRPYVIKQQLGHLAPRVIEEFLETPNQEQKLLLGHYLLRQATKVATDNLHDVYAKLRRDERLHPAMPTDANVLLFDKLGRQSQRFGLLPDLEEALQAVA